MKILIIAPRFPYPPDKGDRLTIYNYLKYFSKKHDVSLITFIKEEERKFVEKISPYCYELINVKHSLPRALLNCSLSLLGFSPFQISYYCWQPAMQLSLKTFLDNNTVDVIYCHTIRMVEYVKNVEAVPKLLAMQISLALNYRRLKKFSNNILEKIFYMIEYALVRNYESNICKDFDRVLLISRKDIDEIQKNGRHKMDNIHLLPHGVDHIYFSNNQSNCELNEDSLIITGNMGYPPNQDAVIYFCQEIFPLIKKEKPGCRLLIVGKNPPSRIKKQGDGQNIIVTGEVKDIRSYLSQASVGIVPTRITAGLQNKLLEGMSMGLPMVATSNANEGIGAKAGEHLMIADDPNDFSKRVLELLNSPEKRKAIGRRARKFVEEEFTWEVFLERLENLMGSLHEKKCADK